MLINHRHKLDRVARIKPKKIWQIGSDSGILGQHRSTDLARFALKRDRDRFAEQYRLPSRPFFFLSLP
jgi:hypothetical protein